MYSVYKAPAGAGRGVYEFNKTQGEAFALMVAWSHDPSVGTVIVCSDDAIVCVMEKANGVWVHRPDQEGKVL